MQEHRERVLKDTVYQGSAHARPHKMGNNVGVCKTQAHLCARNGKLFVCLSLRKQNGDFDQIIDSIETLDALLAYRVFALLENLRNTNAHVVRQCLATVQNMQEHPDRIEILTIVSEIGMEQFKKALSTVPDDLINQMLQLINKGLHIDIKPLAKAIEKHDVRVLDAMTADAF